MDAIKSYEKILIVEDDDGIAYQQRQRLQQHGYLVQIARSREEAVAHAKAGVDMVILDHRLGGVGGLEVCQQFRREGLELPVLLVTEASEESSLIQALRFGVQDVVPRTPHYLDYLPEAAYRMLQQVRARKRLAVLEARRRESQKMEALGQLASGVAHEFNNLLQVIQGFAEVVHEKIYDRPELREDLQQVLDATSRAATVTGQLLAFGSCQSLEMETVDLQALIEDMLKLLRPLLGRGVQIETAIEPNLPPVRGSEAMLGQVFMNLCLNARDAMSGDGRLTISCAGVTLHQPLDHVTDMLRPGAYARVQVSDTGVGIPPEHFSRLYDPFFTTKPIGKGTGMGLATVLGIVKDHAGAVEVESLVGEGTTFTIYLPLSETPPLARPVDPVRSDRGTETLLIADDEPAVRQFLERILSRAGYRVLTAENGEEALEVFRRHPDEIALALLDIAMPKMSGQAVSQAIGRIRPEVKRALISGYGMKAPGPEPDKDETLRMLQKPILRGELLQTVRELLDAAPAMGPEAETGREA